MSFTDDTSAKNFITLWSSAFISSAGSGRVEPLVRRQPNMSTSSGSTSANTSLKTKCSLRSAPIADCTASPALASAECSSANTDACVGCHNAAPAATTHACAACNEPVARAAVAALGRAPPLLGAELLLGEPGALGAALPGALLLCAALPGALLCAALPGALLGALGGPLLLDEPGALGAALPDALGAALPAALLCALGGALPLGALVGALVGALGGPLLGALGGALPLGALGGPLGTSLSIANCAMTRRALRAAARCGRGESTLSASSRRI